eukprot:2020585-Ditylum_brightwellii.AAC.1
MEKVVIASKGSSSEDDNIMSFGWKTVMSSDKPLAEHFGLAVILIRQYGKRLSINHIKSHQDNDTPEKTLNLSARLNIAADQKATQYQIQHGKVDVQVPHAK